MRGDPVHIRLSLMSWGSWASHLPPPPRPAFFCAVRPHFTAQAGAMKACFGNPGQPHEHVQQQITHSAAHIHRRVHLW